MASSCTSYEPNCGSISLCDQNCGVQRAYTHTQRHTETQTDRIVKTEGPKILSKDIFYFKTVAFGGPITENKGIKTSKNNHEKRDRKTSMNADREEINNYNNSLPNHESQVLLKSGYN